ncbi:MAG: hypothetical protein VYC34_04535, partial [Planctomycetota bacterium]|nr:hypothetical protein [Planctomycetota bacterium]
PDCESTYTLDENRSIRSATYRQLNGDAVEAEYTVRDGAIEAIARRDGQIIGEQTVSIDGPVTLTGPHYVTDFFVLHPRDLDVGERQTFTAHAFGFADWRLVEVTIECRRERDRTIRNEHGDKVSTRVYRCEIKTESMSFKTRSWLDDQGIPLKITIDKFPGDVQIRLKPLENAEN